MGQSVNQFTELNSDSHPVNTKPNVMTDALNATLTTKGENQLILQNMTGNHEITGLTPGYQPLGVKVYSNISYIVSGLFDTDGSFISGEIGTYPSPRWGALMASGLNPDYFLTLDNVYSPLKNFSTSSVSANLENDATYVEPFRTEKLNFKSDRLIEVECQPSYDGSVNIIFTDDYNYPRLVNSRFKLDESGKRAAIADRRQAKDTNTYSEARWDNTRLLRISKLIPDLEFAGTQSGGKLASGGYKFYFRYTDSDGAMTDIIEESSLVVISYDEYGARTDENTGKSIKFTLGNVDQSFEAVKVFYSYSGSEEVAGASSVYEIANLFEIPFISTSSTMEIVITGYEKTIAINAGLLNLDYSSVNTVKTIAQHDDRLVFGNMTAAIENYDEFLELSQKIKITEANKTMNIVDAGAGYADPTNVYYNLGLWAGETYENAIVYILPDGKGLSPAFPIRGGDNYENDFSYSSNSTIDTSSGYVNVSGSSVVASSENRLGAYRTSKTRDMLTAGNQGVVRYLVADLSLIQSQARLISEGFFFVRRERRKDAIMQGYICNTTTVDMSTKTIKDEAENGDQNFYSCALPGSSAGGDDLEGAYGQFTAIRNSSGGGIGEYDPNGDPGNFNIPKNRSILPAPGRIWASTIVDVDPNGNFLSKAKGDAFNTQGKITPSPVVASWNLDLPKHYSFYSADALCDAPTAASLFNGSKKGLAINNTDNVIMMESILDDTSIYDVVLGDKRRYGNLVFAHNITANGRNVNFDGVSFDLYENQYTRVITGQMVFLIRVRALPFLNVIGEFHITFNVTMNPLPQVYFNQKQWTLTGVSSSTPSANNNITDSTNASNGESYIDGTGVISGNVTYTTNGSTWTPDAFSYTSFHNSEIDLGTLQCDIYKDNGTPGATPPYSDGDTYNPDGATGGNDVANWGSQYYQAPIEVYTVTGKSIEPIKILDARPFSFDPVTFNSKHNVTGTYVKSGKHSYAHNTFASVSSRNHYGFLNSVQSPTGKEDVTVRTNPALITSDGSNFEDYVGMEIKYDHSDTILSTPLANDSRNVFNEKLFSYNTYGLASQDDKDYVLRVQHQGIRFASLANVYSSPQGPLKASDWPSVYSVNGAGGAYKQVTKRLKWEDFPQGVSDYKQDIFGGDCYLSHTYKRVVKPLGIEGVPTASDPDAYEAGNKDAGLAPKGFVFPLVNECNFNAALRTTEALSATEAALYGKDRDFYPLTAIDTLRASQQGESKGYNFGYNFTSDRSHESLDDSSPIFNTDNSNRVMISAPNVSGSFNNGYSNFSGLNFRDYNSQLGEITKVISHNNVLYCIFETGIGVVPMNQRTMVSEQTGGVFLDDAKVLAEKMQVISSEYGSDQQFSIIKTDGAIYGCDLNKNKIWRILGGQVTIISDFAIQTILNEYKKRLDESPQDNVVVANYDRTRNNIIFSYLNRYEGKYDTDIYTAEEVYTEGTGPGTDGNAGVIDVGDSSEDTGNDTTEEIISTGRSAKASTSTSEKEVSSIKDIPSTETTTTDTRPIVADPILVPEIDQVTGELIPVRLSEDAPGTIYFNETIGKWISQLSWNPLFTFNIGNDLYSFDATDNMDKIWEHFSETSPYCNFYGKQNKFEFEFVIVDNASAQKILNNFMFISNRSFPGRITYSIDNEFDYETFLSTSNSYADLMKQRHENVNWTMNQSSTFPSYMDFGISEEEAERVKGSYFVFNNVFYIIGDSFIEDEVVLVQILDQNGFLLSGLPIGLTFDRIEFGIIKQNMEYKEDHLYTEVGKGLEKSRIRDKAIKVKVSYEGADYVTVQSIISLFVYSHS